MGEPGTERKDEAVEEVAATEVRDRLTELMNRAGYGNERIVLTVHTKQVAALIGMTDLEKLRSTDSAA